MATSEAFTAGLIIVLPLLPVLGILGDCWRREAVEPERGIEATTPWEKERPGAEGMQPTRAG